MPEKTDEDLLKSLCDQAAKERDGQKLIALTNEIIALLDAKQKRVDAWKALRRVS